MSEMEVIGKNGWGKIEFKFSVEINDDGNGATFSNDDGMFVHTDFKPTLSFDGYEIPLDRLRELAAHKPKHARWVTKPPFDDWMICSKCGKDPLCNGKEEEVLSPYCPNCGAAMDLKGCEKE